MSEVRESKKSILRKVSYYTILGFLPMGFNFILAPLITHYLETEEYALLGIADIIGGITAIFISFGFKQAFSRYYFDYRKNIKELNDLMNTAYWSILFFATVVLALSFFFGDHVLNLVFGQTNFTVLEYLLPVLGLTTFTLLNELKLDYYRNEENQKLYSANAMGYFLLCFVGVILGVIVLKKGAIGSIYGRFIGGGIYILLQFVLTIKQKFTFKKEHFLKMAKYGVPLISYSVGLFLFHRLDMIFAKRHFSASEFGVYTFARQVTAIFPVLIFSVFNAISPKIYKYFDSPTPTDLAFVKRLVSLFFFGLVLIIHVGVVAIYPFYDLMVDDVYSGGKNYLFIIFYMFIAQGAYTVISTQLFYDKKTTWLSILSWVSLAVYLLIINPLSSQFDMLGVSFSLMISRYIQLTLMLGIIYFILKSTSVLVEIWKVILASVGSIGLGLIFFSYLQPSSVIFNSIIYLAITIGLISLVFTQDIRWGFDVLKNQLSKKGFI